MTDRQKRARLREILADSKGAIAPGVTDPMFARLAALSAVREMLFELKDTGTEQDYFRRQKDAQEVARWYRDLDMRRQ
jgi:hypothetical protein